MSDTSWFDQLPAGKIAVPPSTNNSGDSNLASAPDWFNQLPPSKAPVVLATPNKAPANAPTMSAPIGVDEWGGPIFDNDAENAQVRGGEMRMLEKAGEGATFGLLPYAIAAARTSNNVPFGQALQDARNYTAETSRQAPVASMIAEGAGSLPATLVQPGLAALKALPYVGRIASPIISGLTGAGLGAASNAGHDIGMGETSNLGSDVLHGAEVGGALGAAAPIVGSAVQALPNTLTSIGRGAKSLLTSTGKDAVAGQVLREAATNPTAPIASSPLPDLQLRTAQATGDRGIAELERQIAPADVQNGRTSDQVNQVVKSLVGSDAGIEPAVLTNQASANGVKALTNLDTALHGVEQKLWNDPHLQNVQLDGSKLAGGTAQDVVNMPASFRDTFIGPQAKLGGFMREIHELGNNASIQDINSIRSRLLGVARDSASGATPDSVTAAAARNMADSLLTRMGADTAIAGAPEQVVPRGWVTDNNGNTTWSNGSVIPAKPANPDAWNAYQAARDFSRQYHQTLGYNEFDSVFNPNAAGNIQGNPETQFGRFFDLHGGTGAGLLRLNDAVELARRFGARSPAQDVEDAANQYMRAAILREARGGAGIDMEGRPNINLATLSSAANKQLPALNSAGIVSNLAPDIQAAGNTAELLNRPSASRGDFNSTTYEKIKKNDLVSAVLGQAGSTGLGALAGAYAAAHYGPDEVPFYLRVAGGLLGGGLAGRMGTSFVGKTIAATPVIKGLVTGPERDIINRVASGLASPDEYRRLLAMPLLNGSDEAIFAPGATKDATENAIRAAIPQTSRRSLPPTINPQTGLPQFNLQDAQRAMADRAVSQMQTHESTTVFVNQNKRELRQHLGGQGIQRIHQVAALLRRSDAPTLFSIIRRNPSPAVKQAMDAHHISNDRSLAAMAIMHPSLAKVLAIRSNRSDLTKAGEAQILAALRL